LGAVFSFPACLAANSIPAIIDGRYDANARPPAAHHLDWFSAVVCAAGIVIRDVVCPDQP
jgi:hypothetical protein